MAINATNYDGTKDYKIAEVGDVYHPNLLVNGDFQVNQRGQDTYTFTGGNNGYTLDMWRIRYGNGVHVTYGKDGVTVDNTSGSQECYFGQSLVDFANTAYSVNVKVSQKTGDVKFYLNGVSSGTALNVGENHFLLSGTPDQFVIYLAKGAKVKITYCDLFASNVNYPHVVEDYATALMRCQKYHFRYVGGNETNPFSLALVKNDKSVRAVLNFPTAMINAPTVTVSTGIKMETWTPEWPSLSFKNISGVTTLVAVLEFSQSEFPVNGPAVGTIYMPNTGSYIDFSCEPL